MLEETRTKNYDSDLSLEQDKVLRSVLRAHAGQLSGEEQAKLFEAIDKLITTATGQAYAIGRKEGRVSAWVPCTSHYPEENLPCALSTMIGAGNRVVMLGTFLPEQQEWYIVGVGEVEASVVTHWQPMPDLPSLTPKKARLLP